MKTLRQLNILRQFAPSERAMLKPMICIFAFALIACAHVQAKAAYSVFYNFGPTGYGGATSLILGNDGNFYGTTPESPSQYGSIFKLTPTGTFSVVYQSTFTDAPDPSNLYQASNGTFNFSDNGYNEYSLVLGSSPVLVAQFREKGRGVDPSRLVEDLHGYLYGTTDDPTGRGPGTIFRLRPDGDYKKLYDFRENSIPTYNPVGPLLAGRDGNLYGAATERANGRYMYGDLFKITPSGDISLLHHFDGIDGHLPLAPLVQDSLTGTIYGVTKYGGAYPDHGNTRGDGIIYEITPGGSFSKLYDFKADRGHFGRTNLTGNDPNPLLYASDGNLYGTTTKGGANGNGVYFEMTPAGVVRKLFDFPTTGNAFAPYGQLVEGPDGRLYGIATDIIYAVDKAE